MGITDLSPGQQPHPGLTWLIEQIEGLASHISGEFGDSAKTPSGTAFVAFANGAWNPEGTPAPSTRDMSEWDVLRATAKAVGEYRDTIDGQALLTWRTAPELTYTPMGGYPEVYLRLAFEPVGMRPRLGPTNADIQENLYTRWPTNPGAKRLSIQELGYLGRVPVVADGVALNSAVHPSRQGLEITDVWIDEAADISEAAIEAAEIELSTLAELQVLLGMVDDLRDKVAAMVIAEGARRGL